MTLSFVEGEEKEKKKKKKKKRTTIPSMILFSFVDMSPSVSLVPQVFGVVSSRRSSDPGGARIPPRGHGA